MSAKLTPYCNLLPTIWGNNFKSNFGKLLDWDSDFGIDSKLFEIPMDVYETDKEIVVEVAFPGISEDKWDIQLTEDSIAIKAEKKTEEKREDIIYHRKSNSGKSFSTSFSLPHKIDSQKSEAKYVDGVLKLTLPKKDVVSSKLTKLKIT